jgi:hypothetical protein
VGTGGKCQQCDESEGIGMAKENEEIPVVGGDVEGREPRDEKKGRVRG